MDRQSKIIASVIVGLVLGTAVAVLLYSGKEDEEGDYLQSGGNANAGAAIADDWSDMNDSLGG